MKFRYSSNFKFIIYNNLVFENANDPCYLFFKSSGRGPYASNLLSVGYYIKVLSGHPYLLKVDAHVHSIVLFFENFNLKETLQSPLYDPNQNHHISLL